MGAPTESDFDNPTGAVDSVNGETGTVVLDAGDVDAVPLTAVGLLAGERNRGVWDTLVAYSVGDVVHDHADGKIYLCTVASTGEQPSLTPGSWTVIDGSGREIALGPGASVTGALGASFGPASEAGQAASAVGSVAIASGAGSVAVGPFAAAAGTGATAVGITAAASGAYAVAIGAGMTATTDGQVVIGVGAPVIDAGVDVNGSGEVDRMTLPGGFVDLPETATTANPAADHRRIVNRAAGVAIRDEAGDEQPIVLDTDARLTDARTPTSHNHAAEDITSGTVDTARLGSGSASSSTYLRGDQTWATVPAETPPAFTGQATGEYVGGLLRTTDAPPANTNGAGKLILAPGWISPGTYDRLEVVSTIAAASKWRLGYYPMLSTGLPDWANVYDAGTVDMSATAGVQAIVINKTVTTGLFVWFAVLVTAFVANPTVNLVGNPSGAWHIPRGFPQLGDNSLYFSMYWTGAGTGGLPTSSPGAMNPYYQAPMMRLRVA